MALLWITGSGVVQGHSLEFTQTLVLTKADGSYQVDMTCDLDALALGAPPTADNALLLAELQSLDTAQLDTLDDKLRRFFERRVRILFDGEAVTPEVSFPHRGTSLATGGEPASHFGMIARFEGRVPSSAVELRLRVSRALPPLLITYLPLHGAPSEAAELPKLAVEPGSDSPALSLVGPSPGQALAGAQTTPWLQTVLSYLQIGFHHILPAGTDHVLFVLTLFLFNSRLRPLLYQVTAFTVAHAVTLALASLGWVSVPANIVEPMIALSIAWMALEALWQHRHPEPTTAESSPAVPSTAEPSNAEPSSAAGSGLASSAWATRRLALIFALGLLHGLGFAGALAETGLPKDQFLVALLSFTSGLEIAQGVVLVAAFVTVGWFREDPRYRTFIVWPASLLLAGIGLWWTAERLLF